MKKLKRIPKFKNEDEERDFWEKADSTEYFDWSKAVKKHQDFWSRVDSMMFINFTMG